MAANSIVVGAVAERGFDAAADFAEDDPFLANLVIGQETAGQEGVAAVFNPQVGQGRAAGAGDEEDQAEFQSGL